MIRYALILLGLLWPGVCLAQGVVCDTLSPGTANQRCASTAFVAGEIANINTRQFSALVSFAAGNTDTPVAIVLPSGFTRYVIESVRISGASASISAGTAGLFTAAGGAGVAIVTGASALTVTASAENTNNNTQKMTINNQDTESYTAATLFWRVATGVAASATVTIAVRPLS